MHSAVALLLALAAASAIARLPGNEPSKTPLQLPAQPLRPPRPPHDLISEYDFYRMMVPQYLGYHTAPRVSQLDGDNWLTREIDRINRMEEEEDSVGPYEKDLARIINQDRYLTHMLDSQEEPRNEPYPQEPPRPHPMQKPVPPSALLAPDELDALRPPSENPQKHLYSKEDPKKKFALTPFDKGYFDPVQKTPYYHVRKMVNGHHEGGGKIETIELQPPRQIRQNPLSKTKNLVAEHLDRLRSGLTHDESGSTEKPHSIRLLEAATPDSTDSIYGVAIIAAVATSLALVIIGFAFGWYTISKRAKAAADVDYPAYGVTGPTVDMSGDRKLAHSAHMYHYQHQKQQIIAMERNGMEQRNGSVSDPESEEENEEGDYTVYECPGFATTGDMEVKNPLFTDDPTPATPGKCELVKPQPKE